MSKRFAVRQTFARLDLDVPREIRPTEPLATMMQTQRKWATRDEVIRIVARVRAQLWRTDRVLMFTGVTQGDGASDLAWETALALSKLEGERILLVETDICAPALHKRLDIPASPGLAEAITTNRFKDSVQTAIEGQLHVMTAGKTLLRPATLFSSPGVAPLMQVLRADYRFVVLSTPPVLTDVSASLLTPFSDGVVLAVASGEQRRAEVRAAHQELRTLNAKILGVVLCDPVASNGLEGGEA